MGSNSVTEAAAASNSSTESLNGLKFGQKIYFEDVGVGAPAKSGGGASSSSSGATPPKKGRGCGVQGAQPPRCQVEGCKVDLSDAKAYYSRHKVCSMHSKSPRVVVAGQEQRFCQQCSRSPLLCFSITYPLPLLSFITLKKGIPFFIFIFFWLLQFFYWSLLILFNIYFCVFRMCLLCIPCFALLYSYPPSFLTTSLNFWCFI